jgi:hypothetical protein
MGFDAPLAATAVGSFPHQSVDAAWKLVLENFPEIPACPQLPATGLNEQMEIQYSEGLPCVVIDEQKRRMYFDTGGDITAILEKCYENYLSDNLDYFAISPEFARGIHAMEKYLSQEKPPEMKYLKMQVTGPVSFALTVVDENKRAIYYNEMFRDVIAKGIAMKARWQLRKFKPISEQRICMIDEPILSAFGSSTYLSVHRDDVVALIHEVAEAIHREGGLAGIHCCGNTEWTIPIDAGVDIINFDAYTYGDSILLYPKQMKAFVESGGILSWGIVPTSVDIDRETTLSLVDRFLRLVDGLVAQGIDREKIVQNSMFTASCGTGSVPVDRAERIARETRNVSDVLKKQFGRVSGEDT